MKEYLLVGLLAVLLLVSSCQQQTNSSNNKDSNIGGNSNQANNDNNKNGDVTSGKQVTINMKAKKWEFDPNIIKAKKGDKVKLVITSEDVKHGFSLSAFNINEDLEPGKTTTIEFTADKTGTYTFVCSVFCGSGHSDMKGELIVE